MTHEQYFRQALINAEVILTKGIYRFRKWASRELTQGSE